MGPKPTRSHSFRPIKFHRVHLHIFIYFPRFVHKWRKANKGSHFSSDPLSLSAQTENREQRGAFLRRRRPTQTTNRESVEIGSDLRRSESVRFLSLFAFGFRFVGVVIWFSFLLCLDLFLDFLNL